MAETKPLEGRLLSIGEGIEKCWPMRPWEIADAIKPVLWAAERETLERAAQIVAGGDISPMTISKQLYEQHRLNGWENPTPDEAIVATLIYVSKALRDLGKG